jgi:hypothetical protein
MNPNRTLAFEVPDRHRDTIPRRHAQQHVYMIHHRMPLQQLDPLLTTQLPEYLPDLMAQSSVHDLPAILWYNDHMVLALPLHVGLTLPIFHDSSPLPCGAFLKENYLRKNAPNGRAFSMLTGKAGGSRIYVWYFALNLHESVLLSRKN